MKTVYSKYNDRHYNKSNIQPQNLRLMKSNLCILMVKYKKYIKMCVCVS